MPLHLTVLNVSMTRVCITEGITLPCLFRAIPNKMSTKDILDQQFRKRSTDALRLRYLESINLVFFYAVLSMIFE